MRPLALAALIATLPSRPLSAPADLAAASRLEAVTVYRSTARVTRAARVELPAGDSRVLLSGLPDQLLDDSVRVEGHGSAPARIFGVAVERITESQAAAAEARAAEERLQRLQDEDRALEDRLRVAQGRQKFVESLRSTYAEERAKNLAVRAVSAREWADLSRFVEGELSQASAELRRAEVGRRELSRKVQAAQAELEKLQAKRSQTTKTLAVELRADRAGPLELSVSYTVPAASWSPVWDARLLPETSKVELALLASIQNRSGEDWREVKLSVSTAQPGRGLFVPQLEPRWLSRLQTVARAESDRATPGVVGLAEMRRAMPAKAASMPAAAPLPEAVEEAKADVEEGLLAATFTAPRRESVDGAGQARRIALQRFTLAAEIGRTAAPRLDPAAFLTAKMSNESGVPLLAGSAGVYIGDEFVGRSPLPFTPPGGELTLAFGADARVEVERRVLERRHETAGIISKDDVWRYRTRISVKNRWGAPVALKLLDLVPVSREKEIEVEVMEGTAPAKDDPERPGIRIHELQLGPRDEKVVEIRYRVRFPRGMAVAGLE